MMIISQMHLEKYNIRNRYKERGNGGKAVQRLNELVKKKKKIMDCVLRENMAVSKFERKSRINKDNTRWIK